VRRRYGCCLGWLRALRLWAELAGVVRAPRPGALGGAGEAGVICVVCGEPFTLVPGLGLVGVGGVCRDPYNPNWDDEGMHVVEVASAGLGLSD
jgi:hypothetical protein